MWRRVGSYLYHLVLLVILVIELTTLAALVYTLLAFQGASQALSQYSFFKLALGVCLVCIAVLVAYILVYPAVSSRVTARYQRRYHEWLQCWCDVLLNLAKLPTAPLPPVAVTALLDQSALLAGSDGRWLKDVATFYKLDRRWLRAVQSRRVDQRLAALSALEAAALPRALPPLLEQMHSRHLLTQIAAARAAVRTLAAIPDLHPQHPDVIRVADVFVSVPLPAGIIEEVLSLDLRASQPLLEHLFSRSVLPSNLVLPLIVVVGQMRLVDMADRIATYAQSLRQTEAAVALHTLAILGYIPRAALPEVRRYLLDDDVPLALAAARLLALLPLEQIEDLLWRALAHPVWDVRCEVVNALLQYGAPGVTLLQRAAQQHPDATARSSAQQVSIQPEQQGTSYQWLGIAV